MKSWTTPSSYYGFDPVGDLILYSRNRDSKIFQESNFECLRIRFTEMASNYPFREPRHNKYDDGIGPMNWVYVFETSHFAVGWIQWIMLREDAPLELRNDIEEVLLKIEEDYGIYDEYDYMNRLWEAKQRYWSEASLKERIEICAEARVSIFAARSESMPTDTDPYILTDE